MKKLSIQERFWHFGVEKWPAFEANFKLFYTANVKILFYSENVKIHTTVPTVIETILIVHSPLYELKMAKVQRAENIRHYNFEFDRHNSFETSTLEPRLFKPPDLLAWPTLGIYRQWYTGESSNTLPASHHYTSNLALNSALHPTKPWQ